MDAHVGKHLFEECFQNFLKGKTRILATHQLQFIKGVDSIIFSDQGKIYEYKDYLELLKYRPEYNSLTVVEKASDVGIQMGLKQSLSKTQIFEENAAVRDLNKIYIFNLEIKT